MLRKPKGRRPKRVRNPKAETRSGSLCSPNRRGYSDFGFRPSFGLRPSAFGFLPPAAFTLIELLVVIAVIALLAAMIIPISGAVSRNKIRSKARVELERVSTAIDMYKAKLGHYPPDNPNRPALNQLYFELLGTTMTNVSGRPTYVTLDGSAQIQVASLSGVYGGVGGFMNTSQGVTGDEGRSASSFLSGLKPDEVVGIPNASGDTVKQLVVGVPAPINYTNFIYYVASSPTNNPNSYDLWVDIVINGKTNRLSNWSTQPTILP